MKHILYKNTKISYSDAGKGTAIVLLHGFLENQSMWDHYVSFFKNDYHIVTIDLLGHGHSDALGYQHTMEENAAVVLAVLSELKIETCTLVGHSMGGYVALALAEKNTDLINGMILLNSTPKEDSYERKMNRDRAIKAVKQSFNNFISMAISNLFSENNREKLVNEINHVKKEALKTPLQGVVASLEGMKIRKNREFVIQNSNFPVLFILGKNDPVLSHDETLGIAERANAQVHSFPDGHMSHIENQTELTGILTNFFKAQ